MNQVIKFPDMRPAKPRTPPSTELPAPAQYRLTSPAILTEEALSKTKPGGRRRLFLWFGVAVALHAALLLGIWLAPPLRIKWTPSPDAWVPLMTLPSKAAQPSFVDPVIIAKPVSPPATVQKLQPVHEPRARHVPGAGASVPSGSAKP
jgi:hypothetical protein